MEIESSATTIGHGNIYTAQTDAVGASGDVSSRDVRLDDLHRSLVATLSPSIESLDSIPRGTVEQARRYSALIGDLMRQGAFDYEALAQGWDVTLSAARKRVLRAAQRHELFTVSYRDRTFVPAFVLDHRLDTRPELTGVLAVLSGAGEDGFALWAWLVTPSAWLDGAVPDELAVTSPERVLDGGAASIHRCVTSPSCLAPHSCPVPSPDSVDLRRVRTATWRAATPVWTTYLRAYFPSRFNASGRGDARFSPLAVTDEQTPGVVYLAKTMTVSLLETAFHDVHVGHPRPSRCRSICNPGARSNSTHHTNSPSWTCATPHSSVSGSAETRSCRRLRRTTRALGSGPSVSCGATSAPHDRSGCCGTRGSPNSHNATTTCSTTCCVATQPKSQW